MEQKENEGNAASETTTEETAGSETQETNIWVRGLLMAFFVVVTRLVEFVVIAVLVTQFIIKLVTKKPNQRLTDFGESLSQYIASIVRYQTFNSEDKPFPFGAWPKVDRTSSDESSGGDGVPPQAQAS